MHTKELEHTITWLDQCIQQGRLTGYGCELTNLGLCVRVEYRSFAAQQGGLLEYRRFVAWPELHAGSWELLEMTLERMVAELERQLL